MTTLDRPPVRGAMRPALLAFLAVAAACSSGSAPARPRGGFVVPVVDTSGGPVGRTPGSTARAGGAFRVRLDPLDGPVPVGGVSWLEAVVTDSLGRRVADAAVLWTSSDTGVVTIQRVGRALAPLTARAEGRAVVTAAVGLSSASTEVRVGALASPATASAPFGAGGGAAQVLVEPRRVDAAVGEQVTLRAVALGTGGDTLRSCPLRWTTSGAPVAPAGGVPAAGATAVYRVLARGPVLVTAACESARGTAVVVVR